MSIYQGKIKLTGGGGGTSMVYLRRVTLSASGWDANALTQTVTVNGIMADETAQAVSVAPAPASMAAAIEAGVYCSGQGANSLTFTCASVPSADITINVSYEGANYLS